MVRCRCPVDVCDRWKNTEPFHNLLRMTATGIG